MGEIKPFRAFRLNQDLGWEPYMFLSPLKDVVSEAQINRLRSLPNNTIHLTQPESVATAVDKLSKWRKENIIIQDPLPAYYPFYQQFSLFGSDKTYLRKGFFALVNVSEDNIIIHEGTLEATLADRTAMLETSKMHLIPVHGLYRDESFTLESLFDPYIDVSVMECFDEQGVKNRMGILQNFEQLRFITDFLKEKPIYLADGHHRLETARRLARKTADRHAQFILMYLTNMASDDLRILPTHRLVRLPQDWNEAAFLEKLRTYFDLLPFNKRSPIYEELKGHQAHFGLMLPSGSHILKLKDSFLNPDSIDLSLPNSVKRLDYTILHYFILQQALNIPYTEQSLRSEISYVKDYTQVVKMVRESTNYLAVIVNEVKMDDMLAVCDDGAKMPQKSTYFFPKVVTGFAFASIADDDYSTPFDTGF
jgi:uncharacterized protein (DUF1015 family)